MSFPKPTVISSLCLVSLLAGALLRGAIEFKKEKTIVEAEQTAAATSEIIYPEIRLIPITDYSDDAVIKKEDLTFSDVKNDLIKDKKDFVEVDLDRMVLILFKEGKLLKEFPVLTKGKEGSWWETPTGKYSVLSKEVNHFSTIGEVWMPWSIRFYGNFFIHGWPYYPDGTSVPKTYSGGCIRLSSEDAKEVFDFVKEEEVILVKDADSFPVLQTALKTNSSAWFNLDILAKSVLAADLSSDTILLNKNGDSRLPIASLTKLMTATVASEVIYLGRSVKIMPGMISLRLPDYLSASKLFSSFLSSVSLIAGQSYTVFDLLYPLLMQSSNAVAQALSSFVGDDLFVSQMNDKARALGMKDTEFSDAAGVDSNNMSTAKDLVKLVKYILDKRSFLLDITKGKNYLSFGPRNFSDLKNFNPFVDRNNLVGVKTGHTSATKETLITVWKFLDDSQNERNIAIVVLGSKNKEEDTQIILDWLNKNFELE